MKNLSFFLLLWFISTIFPVNAQTPGEDFCKKFPLNSRCKDNSLENVPNSRPGNIRSRDNKVIDTLTVDKVENYLRELGYINFTRRDKDGFSFFINGRPCFVLIAPNGKGMILSSAYPQDEKVTLEAINDWNKSFRYSFAYIWTTPENKKSIFFQTNLTVTGGVTETRIKNFFVLHSDYQTRFSRYLDEI